MTWSGYDITFAADRKDFVLDGIIFLCCAGLSDLSQISLIELAVKAESCIKKVLFMTVGEILCAAGAAILLTPPGCGFGLPLIILGVFWMEVTNWIIGTPWAEKNSDCHVNEAYLG
jgi:hypothetical protein